MELRVVLYAEGTGETGGEVTQLPAPGMALDESHLGPAHHLVARCLLSDLAEHDVTIRFVAPLRISAGARLPRGSDLLVRKTLRRLVASFGPARDPDLAIVLVDTDGELQRRTLLRSYLAEPPAGHLLRSIIGAAHQAFEAWLLGDLAALRRVAATAPPPTSAPEGLAPDELKRTLASILVLAPPQSDGPTRTELELRRELAKIVDLQQLRRQRSFEDFSKDLAREACDLAARKAG